MRYSSAVVIGTLAVGQAAAAHNRHASFHARRHAEVKRDGNAADVDWSQVAYDLKDVNWSSVFAQPTPSASNPPAAAPAEPTPAPEAPKPTPAVEATEVSDDLVDAADDGVAQKIASRLGIKMGKNSKSNNGGIWIGTDSQWQIEVQNSAGQEVSFYCWKSSGFTGMFVKDNEAEVSIGLKPGASANLAVADGTSMACAAVYSDTILAPGIGYIYNTWWEATFKKQWGTFDVSKEPYMQGHGISSRGSKCTSNMSTCVFECKNKSEARCKDDYELLNCSAANGGGSGKDPWTGAPSGGCQMGSDNEKVTITLN